MYREQFISEGFHQHDCCWVEVVEVECGAQPNIPWHLKHCRPTVIECQDLHCAGPIWD